MHKFRVVEGRPDTVSLRVRDGETVTVKWDGLKLSAMCTCAQNNERGTCSHAVGVLALDPLVLADDEDATTIDWLKEWVDETSFAETSSGYWEACRQQVEFTALAETLGEMHDRCMASGWPRQNWTVDNNEPEAREEESQTKAL